MISLEDSLCGTQTFVSDKIVLSLNVASDRGRYQVLMLKLGDLDLRVKNKSFWQFWQMGELISCFLDDTGSVVTKLKVFNLL